MSDFQILEESTIRRSAQILGDSSASAKALKDFEDRKARGEEPVFAQKDNVLYVVNLAAGEEDEAGTRENSTAPATPQLKV